LPKHTVDFFSPRLSGALPREVLDYAAVECDSEGDYWRLKALLSLGL
jgi:hypothetical protein